MTNYTLEEYKSKNKANEDFGDFVVYKKFKVTNNKSSHNPEGIVIQTIFKKTIVEDVNKKIYDTTDKINKFTSNKVLYSNDDYIEIFTLNNKGISEYGDNFQNGALTQYDKDCPIIYTKDDPLYNKYKTKGFIRVIGASCFISSTNPIYEILKKLDWSMNKNTPANGLPYKDFDINFYNWFLRYSDSNILVHIVNVNWSFDIPKSIVSSSFYSFNKDKLIIDSKSKKK